MDRPSPRYWNTGDGPTDANLSYMESLARPWPGMTVEHFMGKIRAASSGSNAC